MPDFRTLKDQAEILRRDKQFEQALAVFDELLNLYPDQADGTRALGQGLLPA